MLSAPNLCHYSTEANLVHSHLYLGLDTNTCTVSRETGDDSALGVLIGLLILITLKRQSPELRLRNRGEDPYASLHTISWLNQVNRAESEMGRARGRSYTTGNAHLRSGIPQNEPHRFLVSRETSMAP